MTAVSPRRVQLHRIYYVLALFDLVTVLLSLGLIVRITGIFTASVDENIEWAKWMVRLSDVRSAAADVNRPGNEMFRPGADPIALRADIEAASARFDETFDQLTRDLDHALDDSEHARIDPHAVEVRHAKAAMNDAADVVFQQIRADGGGAGAGMADMDLRYNDAVDALESMGHELTSIQSEHLLVQSDEAHRIRRFEILIAVMILFMVIAVAAYGHALAKQRRRLTEETEERLKSLVAARTRELERSNEQLRTAERLASVGTMAAGVGHDLNNMLFPMRCQIDVLLRAAEAAGDDHDELTAIAESIRYLEQLSDGLRLLVLDPDEAESGNVTTDLTSWWAETSGLLVRALPRRVTFDVHLPDDLPPVVIAPHRLSQAVLNLIVNAGEAVAEDGHVRLEATRVGDAVRIAVIDDGPGMTPDVRRYALDPFFTTKPRGMSTGLGLALVHGIANGGGGSLDIESEPGSGTTVAMTMPLSPADATDQVDAEHRRALVTLDDRRTATFVGALLDAAGIEVAYDESSDGSYGLWVTDSRRTDHAVATRFLAEDARRRIILCEPDAASWTMEGVGTIRPDDAAGMKRAIHSVIEAANGIDS